MNDENLPPNTLRHRRSAHLTEDAVTPPGITFLVRIKAKFYGAVPGATLLRPGETPSKDAVHRTFQTARRSGSKVPTMLICNEHGIAAESLVTGQAVLRVDTTRWVALCIAFDGPLWLYSIPLSQLLSRMTVCIRDSMMRDPCTSHSSRVFTTTDLDSTPPLVPHVGLPRS
jgi:hypothetical protein